MIPFPSDEELEIMYYFTLEDSAVEEHRQKLDEAIERAYRQSTISDYLSLPYEVIKNPHMETYLLREAKKIVRSVKEAFNREVAQKIYEHTRYLGEGPRDASDWQMGELLVWRGMGLNGILEAALTLLIYKAVYIVSGRGVPNEVVYHMDSWKERHLKQEIKFLDSLPDEQLEQLFSRAADEIPGDEFFVRLIIGRRAWSNCFLDWIRERPIGAMGCECGIHNPVPSYYEVVSQP